MENWQFLGGLFFVHHDCLAGLGRLEQEAHGRSIGRSECAEVITGQEWTWAKPRHGAAWRGWRNERSEVRYGADG